MKKLAGWFRTRKKAVLRIVVLLLVSAIVGAGASVVRGENDQLGLNDKITGVRVDEGRIFCTLIREEDNLLLCLNEQGELLNYCRTELDQTIRNFCVDGNMIYAILDHYDSESGRIEEQSLVSLSMDRRTMRPWTIRVLDHGKGILWDSLTREGGETILMAGTDPAGEIYGGEYSLNGQTERVRLWVSGQHASTASVARRNSVAWISAEKTPEHEDRGAVGWMKDGRIKRDLLEEKGKTPCQLAVWGAEFFVLDSASGDIYYLDDSQSAQLFRSSGTELNPEIDKDYQYGDFENFTVYQDETGRIRILGTCRDGLEPELVGDALYVPEITGDRHPLSLRWQQFWPPAVCTFLALALLMLVLGRILHSRRLSTRLLLCELLAALLMLGTVIGLQYRTYHNNMYGEALNQMALMADTLAEQLNGDRVMSDEEVAQLAQAVEERYSGEQNHQLQVIWRQDDSLYIGYDRTIPSGYLLQNAESYTYNLAVWNVLEDRETAAAGHGIPYQVQDAANYDYIYLRYIHQGDWEGCVAVCQDQDLRMTILRHLSDQIFILLVTCPPLFLVLIWITRRMLAPLDTIRRALEKFYTCGGGNQMDLKKIPRTELYEVGRVFNQLSVETQTQMNQLHTINDAYARIVPNSMLEMLRAGDVSALEAGRTSQERRSVLVIAPDPEDRSQNTAAINAMVDKVGQWGGIVVDHDEQLNALTALLPTQGQALDCARACVQDNAHVFTAVLREQVRFGVFGGDYLLFPLAFAAGMSRRLAVLNLLGQFGAKVIRCDCEEDDLRLLGWDDGRTFSEELSWYDAAWKSDWQEAGPIWSEALELYRQGEFALAMRKFAKVLRLMPEDAAARWYLFRCEALRDAEGTPSTELLYEWEESQ